MEKIDEHFLSWTGVVSRVRKVYGLGRPAVRGRSVEIQVIQRGRQTESIRLKLIDISHRPEAGEPVSNMI